MVNHYDVYKNLQEALKKQDFEIMREWLEKTDFPVSEVSNVLDYYKYLLKIGCKRVSEFSVGETVSTSSGLPWTSTEKRGMKSEVCFKPDLTPDMMLRLGVFDGSYIMGWEMDVPLEWIFMSIIIRKIKIPKISNSTVLEFECQGDKSYNFYSVSSVQNIDNWEKSGWVRDQDPKGWFQWYIRFYLGRRTPDDSRQKDRWLSFKRHVYQIRANSNQERLRQRQACVQWGYNPDK
jgi:hypothetical protein